MKMSILPVWSSLVYTVHYLFLGYSAQLTDERKHHV
uniref:Uncharacterized protein n=1 Tax=Anguilla anguilla TaxID=7936 RepID=A0A0E9S1V2_ANGAN